MLTLNLRLSSLCCMVLMWLILSPHGRISGRVSHKSGLLKHPRNLLWLPSLIKCGIWVYLMQFLPSWLFQSCATLCFQLQVSCHNQAGLSLGFFCLLWKGKPCQTSMFCATANDKAIPLRVGELHLFPQRHFMTTSNPALFVRECYKQEAVSHRRQHPQDINSKTLILNASVLIC